MTQALALWANGQRVAELAHEAMDDKWSFGYDAAWLKDAAAFPLSPALPLTRPAEGYPSAVVKRFIENLLPEGRALEVIAAISKVSKSNVYALIAELGAETTGAFRFWPAGEAPPMIAAEPLREVTRQELQQRLDDRALERWCPWLHGTARSGCPSQGCRISSSFTSTSRSTMAGACTWQRRHWRLLTSSSPSRRSPKRRTWSSMSTSA
jgi:HipA-like protein